jgi:hypothetical protein
MGSLRKQLINQFFLESIVVCLAFVLSLGLVILSLPYFNEVGRQKNGHSLEQSRLLGAGHSRSACLPGC